MKLSRGARRDNLFNSFFRCLSALALIYMKLFNVCANKLSLSLSLSLFLILIYYIACMIFFSLKSQYFAICKPKFSIERCLSPVILV